MPEEKIFTEDMGQDIIRVEKSKNFSVVCNEIFRRKDVSWKAKGIMAYILTLPDDWKIRGSEIKNHASDGQDSFYAGWRELKSLGYVKTQKNDPETGKLIFKTTVYESVQGQNPYTEKPYREKPYKENPYKEKPYKENPYKENPYKENPYKENPYRENPTLLNTDLLNTDLLSTNKQSTYEKNSRACRPTPSSPYEEEVMEKVKEIIGRGETEEKEQEEIEEKKQEEIEEKKQEEVEAERKKQEQKDPPPYEEIIGYLNAKTGKAFKADSKATRRFIDARWKEGYRLEHFKKVIDNKCFDWLDSSTMEPYLRPSTLFSPKFESYVNEKKERVKSEYEKKLFERSKELIESGALRGR